MRIILFCYDFFYESIVKIQEDGHTIVKIYSFETDEIYNSSARVREFCRLHDIPIMLERPSLQDIIKDQEEIIDLFMSLGYPYKIPTPTDFRGINIHPTILPAGRGPYPIPLLVLSSPEIAGLTLHKITENFDSGDILAQIKVTIDSQDSLDVVSTKLQLAAPIFILDTIKDIETKWKYALPQGEGYYWKACEKDWTIDFSTEVSLILKVARAFGSLDASAKIEGEDYIITSASGWIDNHSLAYGTVVSTGIQGILVACKDGYVLLKGYPEHT